MASNLLAMASNLLVMAANLIAMASNILCPQPLWQPISHVQEALMTLRRPALQSSPRSLLRNEQNRDRPDFL